MKTYLDTYLIIHPALGSNDTWGSCLGTGHCHEYHEQNLTVQEFHNIGIYEPCNYASNLAYYRVVTSICGYQQWSLPAEYQVAMAQAFTGASVVLMMMMMMMVILMTMMMMTELPQP